MTDKQDITEDLVQAIYKAWLNVPGSANEFDLIRMAIRAHEAAKTASPAGERANKLSRRWMAMINYAYQCRDDIRSSSGHTPRSSELRLLEEEMRAALAAQPEPAAQDKYVEFEGMTGVQILRAISKARATTKTQGGA